MGIGMIQKNNQKKTIQSDLLFKEEVYTIIGAAMEVHTELGSGFLESVYEKALIVEFKHRHIPFQCQVQYPVFYKGIPLEKIFIADIVAYQKIIIELKAIHQLTAIEMAQTINYLKVSGCKLGLLINFGSIKKLEWQRLVL